MCRTAFPLVEFHYVPVGLFLQPVKVPLDGSTTLECVKHSSQFYLFCKFAEVTLCSPTLVTNDHVKQYWPNDSLYTTSIGLQMGFTPLITTF